MNSGFFAPSVFLPAISTVVSSDSRNQKKKKAEKFQPEIRNQH
jgi:hypothetical protein